MKPAKSLVALSVAMLFVASNSFATQTTQTGGPMKALDSDISKASEQPRAARETSSNESRQESDNSNSLSARTLALADTAEYSAIKKTNPRATNLAPDAVETKLSESMQAQQRPAPAPEPQTYAMLLAGLGMMAFVVRRRKRQY